MSVETATAGRHAHVRGGVPAAYRAERRKLLAQTSTKVLALVCLLAPFAFALVVSRQSGVPGDSLLGVWVHSSGYAVGFVVLDFAGYLGLPILAGLAAGDLFASEDRQGTWKTLLTRSLSRREVFAGKVLAGFALAGALALVAAISSILGALLFVGSEPLVGLGGVALPPAQALALLLCSWLLSLLPLAGFVAIAVLLSVAFRSGIAGVVGTFLIGLLMQLLAFLGSGSWMQALLLGAAFDDWHGLLADPRFYAPMAIAAAVSAAWTAVALLAAWLLFRRREFAGPPVSRRPGWRAPLRLVLAGAVALGVLGAASGLGRTTITGARLEASISGDFERLTILQQRELGRAVPAGARIAMRTSCARHSGAAAGPGDDWTCTMTLAAAQAGWDPLSLTPVTYDVSVEPDGCYKADAPPSFVGLQDMTDARGASVVNPLFVIYGCFDPTSPGRCPATTLCAGVPPASAAAPAQRASPPAAGASPREREREQRQLREAERRAGPKVLREQEESVRRFEQEEAEERGRAPGG